MNFKSIKFDNKEVKKIVIMIFFKKKKEWDCYFLITHYSNPYPNSMCVCSRKGDSVPKISLHEIAWRDALIS